MLQDTLAHKEDIQDLGTDKELKQTAAAVLVFWGPRLTVRPLLLSVKIRSWLF
jgi:hypothetical protein